jgi:hypothetical protein
VHFIDWISRLFSARDSKVGTARAILSDLNSLRM